MKTEMYKIFRKSSPRTGKKFDFRWVPRKQLAQHLAAGWMQGEKKKKNKK